ncbi:MAG: hypothetical protein ACXW27_07240 [Allosphingosinicella sp.]
MQKRETKMPLRSWAKPEVRRIVSGSAESSGGGASDGSATFS